MPAGTYRLHAEDDKGCYDDAEITIYEPDYIDLVDPIFTVCDKSIQSSITGSWNTVTPQKNARNHTATFELSVWRYDEDRTTWVMTNDWATVEDGVNKRFPIDMTDITAPVDYKVAYRAKWTNPMDYTVDGQTDDVITCYGEKVVTIEPQIKAQIDGTKDFLCADNEREYTVDGNGDITIGDKSVATITASATYGDSEYNFYKLYRLDGGEYTLVASQVIKDNDNYTGVADENPEDKATQYTFTLQSGNVGTFVVRVYNGMNDSERFCYSETAPVVISQPKDIRVEKSEILPDNGTAIGSIEIEAIQDGIGLGYEWWWYAVDDQNTVLTSTNSPTGRNANPIDHLSVRDENGVRIPSKDFIIKVYDTEQCYFDKTFTVGGNSLQVDATAIDNQCYTEEAGTGSITLTITGQYPYTVKLGGEVYVDAEGNRAEGLVPVNADVDKNVTYTLSNLMAGTYQITVVDANNVSLDLEPIVIENVSDMQRGAVTSLLNINGTGVITAKVRGGALRGGVPYYQWYLYKEGEDQSSDKGSVSEIDAEGWSTITTTAPLTDGVYYLQVYDFYSIEQDPTTNNTCSIRFDDLVLSYNLKEVQPLCETSDKGSLEAELVRAIGNITYKWYRSDTYSDNIADYTEIPNDNVAEYPNGKSRIEELEPGYYVGYVNELLLDADGVTPLRDFQLYKAIRLEYQKTVVFDQYVKTPETCAGNGVPTQALVTLNGFTDAELGLADTTAWSDADKELYERNLVTFTWRGHPGKDVTETVKIARASGKLNQYYLESATLATYLVDGEPQDVDYELTIRAPQSGCVFVGNTTIKGIKPITFKLTPNNICDIATRTLTVSDFSYDGEQANYDFVWVGDSIPNDFTFNYPNTNNLPSGGNYTLTVSDKNNASCAHTESIFLPSSIGVEYETSLVSCVGGKDGRIEIRGSNGEGFGALPKYDEYDYTYEWYYAPGSEANATAPADGAFTEAITPNEESASGVYVQKTAQYALDGPAGWYQVIVRNNNPLYAGCEKKVNIFIDTYKIDADVSHTDIISCETGTGTISVRPRGGNADYTVTVKVGNNVNTSEVLFSQSGIKENNLWTFENVPAGEYTVVVVDAKNCQATYQVEVLQTAQLTASLVEFTMTAGETSATATGTAQIKIEGGSSQQYLLKLVNNTTGSSTNFTVPKDYAIDANNIVTIDNLVAGEYSVEISDNNPQGDSYSCKTQLTLGLNVDVKPYLPQCETSNDGKIQLTVTGQTDATKLSYTIAKDGTDITATVNKVATTTGVTFENLEPGIYSIVVTDDEDINKGTYTLVDVELKYQKILTVSVSAHTDVTCNGNADGTITLNVVNTGLERPVSYQWYKVVAGDGTAAAPYQFNVMPNNSWQAAGSVFSGFTAGTYKVRVFEGNDPDGCYAESDVVTLEEDQKVDFQLIAIDGTGDDCDVTTRTVEVWRADDFTSIDKYDLKWSGAAFTLNSNPQYTAGGAPKATAPAGYTYVGSITNLIRGGELTLTLENKTSGCTNLVSHSVTLNDELTLELVNVEPITSVSKAEIVVKAAGGNGDGSYVYTWYKSSVDYDVELDLATLDDATYAQTISGLTEGVYDNLEAGYYKVVVTDGICNTTLTNIVVPSYEGLSVRATATEVSCNGQSDATITAVATGGNAPYTYQWYMADASDNYVIITGQTASQLKNVSAGSYKVVVRDSKGAENEGSAVVVEPVAISFTIEKSQDISCEGNEGKLSIIFDDTDLQRSAIATAHQLTDGEIIANRTHQAAGEYDQIVLGNSWNAATHILTIAYEKNSQRQQMQIEINWNGTNVSDATGLTQQELVSGSYTVTASVVSSTGAKNCPETRSVTFVQPLSATYVSSNSTCTGNNTGTITVTTTGGSGEYLYAWADLVGFDADGNPIEPTEGQFTALNARSNLAKGTYYVRIKDNVARDMDGDANTPKTNCTYPLFTSTVANHENGWLKIEIGDNYPFSVKGVSTDVTCFEEQNGTISVAVQGGSGSYIYNWSGSGEGLNKTNTVYNQTGLASGNYQVTVTDRYYGCSVSEEYTIAGPVEPLVASATVTNVSCFGESNGSLTFSITGGSPFETGSQYKYRKQGEDDIDVRNELPANNTIEGLEAGNYIFYIYDANDCVAPIEVTIGSPERITFSYDVVDVSIDDPFNGKVSIGDITGGTQPYTLEWSTYATTYADGKYHAESVVPFAANDNLKDQYMLSPVAAGTYYARVRDVNGCYSSEEGTPIVVTDNGALSVSIRTDKVLCYGESNGAINIMINNGKRPFNVYVDDVLVEENYPGTTMLVLEGYPVGDYKVRIEDRDGGALEQDIPVEYADGANVKLDLTLSTNDTPICFGTADAYIDYEVTGGRLNQTVIEGNTIDHYKSVTLSPGAKRYADEKALPVSRFDNLKAGTYIVTVTDQNNCQISGEITINEYPEVKIEDPVKRDVSCYDASDGSFSAALYGGNGEYRYYWQRLNPTTINTYEDFMLPTGNVPSSVNPERASSKANTVTLNNIPGGTYKLVVEDEHYCTKETIFVIDEPTRLYYTIAHEDVRSCDADVATGSITVQVTGGTPSYQILLDGGAPVYTTGYYRFSGLIAGNHYVTISDANGCDKFYDVNNGAELQPANSVAAGELSQPPVEVVINKYQPIEIGNLEYVMDDTQDQLGSASFTVRGGNLNNRGEYRINISLSSEDVDGFGARNITLLSSNTTGTTNNTLTTGKYSYVWDENTEQFLVTFSDLEAGTYNISAVDIVTNEATCSTNDGFELSKLALTYTTTDPYCSGIKNGQIAVNVTGAVSVVHYSWEKFNNGGWELISYQTTSTLVGQDAGRYRVTVYDGALDDNIDSDNNHKIGMLQQEFTLAYDRAYQLNENITPVTCYGDNNGAISIVVEGEKSDIPLTYIWSGVAGFASTEQNISNLVAGYYYLQVVDNDGCQVSKSYEVKQPSQISYSISVVDGSVDCENNTRRFQFDAEPIGGERYANGAHYRYTITGPADDQQIGDWDELADVNRVFVNAGTYTMNVEDANGCVAKRTFEVPDAISLINIPPTVGNVSCYNGSDGYISLEVTGVVNPTFQWYSDDPTGKTGAELDAITVRNNTSRSSSLENIPAGTYWVVISRTDASGQDCHRTFGGVQDGFVVAQPQKMTFTATAFDETGCSDEASGKIAVNVVYGTAPYTVMLYGASNDAIVRTTPTGDYTFGELQGSADASGYLYQVQVIDANGCLAVTEADNTKYIQECSVRKPAQLKINNVETGVALGQATKGGFITFDISGGVTGGAANGYSYRVSLTSTSFANIFTIVTDANGNVTNIEPNTSATFVDNKVTISGLDAGIYDLSVLDVYSLPSNCTASEQVIVSQLQLIAEYTDPSCSSLNNGTINVSVTGATGTNDVEYTWFYNERDFTVLDDDPEHAGAVKSKNNIEETDPSYEDYYAANKMYLSGVVGSYLKEGYYTILATDKSGNEIVAQAIKQVKLVYKKRLSILPSIVPEQCFGAEDGSISVTVLNNGAPSYEHYTYQWSGADKEVGNDFKVTNLAPGEYFLTITDDEGCSFTSDGLIVDAATQLSFRLDGDQIAVNCGVTGKYNRVIRILDANGNEPKYRDTTNETYENSTDYLSPLGGTGPYRFSWSGAAPVTKITAGYQYVDNDGNLIEVNGQNVEMDNDGNVEIILSDGNPVNLHEGDIWNLAKGGTYNVTMTDANGCKLTQSVTIPVEIEAEKVISTPVSCYGGYYVYGEDKVVKKANGENVQTEAELAVVLENLGLEANRVSYNTKTGYYVYKKDLAVLDRNGRVVTNETDLAAALAPAGLSLANNDVIAMPGSIDGGLEVVLVEGIETFSYWWYNNKVENGVDVIDMYEDDGTTLKEPLSTKSSVSGLTSGKYWVHVEAGSCQKDLGPYVISQSIEPLQLVATPTNITSCVNSETGRITCIFLTPSHAGFLIF